METKDSQSNSGEQQKKDDRQEASQNAAATSTEIKLRCFQDNAAPAVVLDGWQRLTRFTKEAKSDFWNVLRPTLMRPNHPSNERLLKTFCSKFSLAEADVVDALRCCDLLFRRASALNLDHAAFQQDLTALSSGDAGAEEFLMAQFDEAKGALRQQIILDSLADHGKLIVGVDWRIDDVSVSDRGVALNKRVVLMTLRYREGNMQERITFQLTPEAINELRQFCNRFST